MTSMTKTITIEFEGGFHNSGAMTLRATTEGGAAYISAGQFKRLQNHFCGMASCECGGAYRANMALPAGWVKGSITPDAGAIAWLEQTAAHLDALAS
jgi:hypothetical protein